MTSKEILKEAFDSDLEVLEKAFESDTELYTKILDLINVYTSIIWTALSEEGIITLEKSTEYIKKANEFLNSMEKEGIKDE